MLGSVCGSCGRVEVDISTHLNTSRHTEHLNTYQHLNTSEHQSIFPLTAFQHIITQTLNTQQFNTFSTLMKWCVGSDPAMIRWQETQIVLAGAGGGVWWFSPAFALCRRGRKAFARSSREFRYFKLTQEGGAKFIWNLHKEQDSANRIVSYRKLGRNREN